MATNVKQRFGKLRILCPNCNKWSRLRDVDIDDEVGYPYWGYPVCPHCQQSNKDFKYLMRLQGYVRAGYLTEDRLLLIRSLSQ